VLEVEEQPVEARRLHDLDDVDVANQSHTDAHGQLILLQPRFRGVHCHRHWFPLVADFRLG
jgi:hypothetical protein